MFGNEFWRPALILLIKKQFRIVGWLQMQQKIQCICNEVHHAVHSKSFALFDALIFTKGVWKKLRCMKMEGYLWLSSISIFVLLSFKYISAIFFVYSISLQYWAQRKLCHNMCESNSNNALQNIGIFGVLMH